MSRFTNPQIMPVLRQAENEVAVPELCREHGISTASFSKWRAKYCGMDDPLSSSRRRDGSHCPGAEMLVKRARLGDYGVKRHAIEGMTSYAF